MAAIMSWPQCVKAQKYCSKGHSIHEETVELTLQSQQVFMNILFMDQVRAEYQTYVILMCYLLFFFVTFFHHNVDNRNLNYAITVQMLCYNCSNVML